MLRRWDMDRDSCRPLRNDNLLRQVLEEVAGLEEVPVLVMGDFNLQPEHSATLRAAEHTGRWFDVAAAFAGAQSTLPAPTCYARTRSGRAPGST